MEKLQFVTINQPTKILKSKLISGLCTICEERGKLRNMDSDNIVNGEIENYSKMLMTCYNIKLLCYDEQEYTEICEACAARLRDAYSFRRQVEAVDLSSRLRTRSKDTSNKIMQIILNKFNCQNETEENSRRILLKKRIKSEVLEKLKLSNETLFKNCIIKRNSKSENLHKLERLHKTKRRKENKKRKSEKSRKKRMFQNYDIEHHIKTENSEDFIENHFKDFDTFLDRDFTSGDESSSDSADIKNATGFVKQSDVKIKKDIFLIPALEPSSKICPICEMVPNSRQSLIRHYYDTHFPSFLCHLCGYGTTLRDSFTGHMKTHQGVKYSCSSCPKIFCSPISRYHHEKAIHKKIPLFNCSQCKATFSHSVTRRKHMFEKHGVQCLVHQCKECGKVFYSEHRLSVHIKRSHLQHRPFACNVCGYRFFQNCDLRDHMTKHTGAKDFNCEQCGKCFSRRACLMEHLKIHANIRNFRCEICDKTFVQKASLKGHMKTHDRNTTKPITEIQ